MICCNIPTKTGTVASKHGCKILNHVSMRREMHLTSLVDLKDTRNMFWWITLNVNNFYFVTLYFFTLLRCTDLHALLLRNVKSFISFRLTLPTFPTKLDQERPWCMPFGLGLRWPLLMLTRNKPHSTSQTSFYRVIKLFIHTRTHAKSVLGNDHSPSNLKSLVYS